MSKCFKAIFNRKNIGVLLIAVAFVLCFILICIIRYQGVFLSNHRKELKSNKEEITGTYYTIDYKNLDTYALVRTPGQGLLNGRISRRRVVQAMSTTKVDGVEFTEVDYAGLGGWVKSDKLMKISEKNIAIEKGTLVYVDISSIQKVNLYSDHAWSNDPLVEEIPYGTEFTLQDAVSGWGKVEYKDQTGWINLTFASIYLPGQWIVSPYDKNVKSIEMKKSAKESSKTILKIPVGRKLMLSEFQNGWSKITFKNKTGWIKLNDMMFTLE